MFTTRTRKWFSPTSPLGQMFRKGQILREKLRYYYQ